MPVLFSIYTQNNTHTIVICHNGVLSEAHKTQGPIGGGLRCAADMYPYYFEEFLLYYGPYDAVPLWHQSRLLGQTFI